MRTPFASIVPLLALPYWIGSAQANCWSCPGGVITNTIQISNPVPDQNPSRIPDVVDDEGESKVNSATLRIRDEEGWKRASLGEERKIMLLPGKVYPMEISAQYTGAKDCPSANLLFEGCRLEIQIIDEDQPGLPTYSAWVNAETMTLQQGSSSANFKWDTVNFPDAHDQTNIPHNHDPDEVLIVEGKRKAKDVTRYYVRIAPDVGGAGTTAPQAGGSVNGANWNEAPGLSRITQGIQEGIFSDLPEAAATEFLAEPAIGISIPLGGVDDSGMRKSAGSLRISHPVGDEDFSGIGVLISSEYFNPSDEDNDAMPVHWDPATGDPRRILVSEEAVICIEELSGLLQIDVYPASGYNVGSRIFTGQKLAIYKYEITPASTGFSNGLRISEWTGAFVDSLNPVKVTDYGISTDKMTTTTSSGGRTVTVTEDQGLDLTDAASIRASYRSSTTTVHDNEELVSKTIEEYCYIPIYHEALLLRVEELPTLRRVVLNSLTDTGLDETWHYYGQHAALLGGNIHLNGKLKFHQRNDGGWILYGYDIDGNVATTYEPWESTMPPSLDPVTGVGVVDGNTELAVMNLPVKQMRVEAYIGTETYTQTAKTWLLEDGHAPKIIRDATRNIVSEGGSSVSHDELWGATITDQIKGTWNPATGNAWSDFTPAAPGTEDSAIHTMSVVTQGTSWTDQIPYSGGQYVIPGRSIQTITISGMQGLMLEETRILPPGVSGVSDESSFVPATQTTYAYDAYGRQTYSWKDGRIIVQNEYPTPVESVEIDQTGIITRLVVDGQGRTISRTVEGGGGVASITETTEYDGLETREMVNGVLVSRAVVDLAGRPILKEDRIGSVTEWSYSSDGRTTTETRPGGSTVVTAVHRDGRVESITGTGVVATYNFYGLEEDEDEYYHQATTTRVGAPNSPRYTKQVFSWESGELLRTLNPDAKSGSYEVTTEDGGSGFPYSGKFGYTVGDTSYPGYAGPGSIASSSFPAFNAVGSMGMHTYSGRISEWISDTWNGPSRLIEISTEYVLHEGKWWKKVTESKGIEEPDALQQTYSMTRLWQGDGLKNIDLTPDGEIETTVTVFNRGQKESTTTVSGNRSLIPQIIFMVNGRIQWQQGKHSSDAAHRATLTYDSLGRVTHTRDHRGAVTRTVYNGVGQVEKMFDTLGRATTYSYVNSTSHGAGNLAAITRPDGQTTIYNYTVRGQIDSIGGTVEYPQSFTYNEYGDKETLTTTSASGSSVTRWEYNAAGLLAAKYYNHGSGDVDKIEYTYDPFGRLEQKEVVGGKVTKYTYNAFGETMTINYGGDGNGEDVIFTRNNAGLVAIVNENYEDADGGAMGSGSTAFSYTAGRVSGVEYDGGHSYLPGVKLDYETPDPASGLPKGYEVFNGATSRMEVAYGYDDEGRLASVGSLHGTFSYSYHPGSGIVAGYTGDLSGGVVTQTRPVDFQGRVSSVTTRNGSGGMIASVGYSYDLVDRRTQTRREDGTSWSYSYNGRGEVTGALRRNTAGDAINGLAREYYYDDIGNRNWMKYGGGQTGALTHLEYTRNGHNQYSKIEYIPSTSATAWMVGRAPALDDVYVNTQLAGRQETWFSHEIGVSNTGGPVNLAVEVTDNLGSPVSSGNLAVPAASTIRTYDEAGNLASDGMWEYKWDSENRLREMKATDAATNATFPDLTIEFVYDWQGRRIAKKVTEGVTVTHKRYLYEGWNVVAEWTLHGSSITFNAPQTYLWGLDLSGQQSGDVAQIQGAGGVGGLLAADVRKVSDASALGKVYASYDGNGNILAWSGADGTIKQSQDYDSFGNIILKSVDASGPLGGHQGEVDYGFSTKPLERDCGLIYYGCRYYDPLAGRWSARDPIEELGGVNLYGFVDNAPINSIDYLGMWKESEHYELIDFWMESSRDKLPAGSTYSKYNWHCLNINVTQMLKNGNDLVDGTGEKIYENFISAQSKYNSYQHAMRAPEQAIIHAELAMRVFIESEVNLAKQMANSARRNVKSKVKATKFLAFLEIRNAITRLGKAQHPVADSTSPAHAGFQIWGGLGVDQVPLMIMHARRETAAIFHTTQPMPYKYVKNRFEADLLEILKE
ncbi:hypothetical protein OVA24_06815 [Luteolibacter sp. SL250]|uniref:RHS repeat domain-containing protein n=1 Tax=Luteolibacter sp. SL250 TaxID=2995170 RepID=UPI00226D61ED|nr:RHS repeat-associated core domain-containing protein [Luteolibacter sp. SL250]WAC21093.1 hypothetical protein OVA24_06815 [Luteolibacter sp. SL250]